MNRINRRQFLSGAAATLGVRAIWGGPSGAARLKLGVLSDVHVSTAAQVPMLEKAFAYFRDHGADGVIIAGDMANTGRLEQLDLVGEAWFRVFPNGKAPDGRPVEKLFVFGNHDVAFRGSPIGSDRKAAWERAFREPWTGDVYAKQVKGYVFIGAHWGCEKQLEGYLAANAERLGLNGKKPFFYAQHPHPAGTVQGAWAWGNDRGVATKALSRFANAVAFSGHSHYSHTDERCVWQGAFTSIGTSSLRYIFAQYGRENGERYGRRPLQMPCLNEHAAHQGMLMTVHDDCLVLERLDFNACEKTGPDWIVPLDGSRAFAFESRRARVVAPEFPAGATVAVRRLRGRDRAGRETEQVEVAFPPAAPDARTARVYDYEVRALAPYGREDREEELAVRRVLSTSFHLPPVRETKETQRCIFALADLRGAKTVRFEVRPGECFGTRGRSISTKADFDAETSADGR